MKLELDIRYEARADEGETEEDEKAIAEATRAAIDELVASIQRAAMTNGINVRVEHD